jgi:putative chitinase
MNILRRGDNSEMVRELQQKLGISPTVTNFGPKTEAAVREFQQRNRLPVTGIVDKMTWDMIMGNTTQSSTSTLNIERLRGIIPQNVLDQIPETIQKFELNTPLRLAHFLAQCGHESGEFRLTVENLNYSAQQLANTWPARFAVNRTVRPLQPNQMALDIQRNPQRIANIVYANRMSNGDEASGDGWRFRGRGYIQLTGRSNYTAFNRFVSDDVIANPDLVATKYPLLSAAWFFHTNGIHRIADGGSSRTTVEAVTRRVNGGLIGIAHRLSEFEKYFNKLK